MRHESDGVQSLEHGCPLAAPSVAGAGPQTVPANFCVPFDEIMRAVCDEFCISQAKLVGRGRSPGWVVPRHVGYWLTRSLTTASFPTIGSLFGGRHHTAIMAGCRKINRHVDEKTSLGMRVIRLRAQLMNHARPVKVPEKTKVIPFKKTRRCLRCRNQFETAQNYFCCENCRGLNNTQSPLAEGYSV